VASELARVVSREVRETDLFSLNEEGRLSVVLLDADLPNAIRVLERLLSRFEHYEFTSARSISVGAACCPTHGADAESLFSAAEVRSMDPRREPRGSASQSQ
jgi:GGDEF domain-containing protein